MAGNYILVHDFLDKGYPLWPMIFGGLGIAAGVGICFERNKMMPNRSPEQRMALSVAFLMAFIIWTAGTSLKIFREYLDITRAIEHGAAQVTQGQVDSYKPFLTDWNKWEEFCVKGTCFHYNDFIPSAGYNNTARYGGPMRKDLYVRVIHTGNTIIKLELLQ